ncbi:MAG TPA: LamG domain-containing protein, partial [Sedimentisphaerales bacterium]|nr:LamG domain-containing protein [Sedimentisphaerales bacterium]
MCKKLVILVPLILAAIEQISYAGLVAYWDLEEGSGTTTTAAVGSPDADGTLVGATWITAGLAPIDGSTAAAFFNSANADRIETNYPGILGQAARSVAVWIKAEPTQNNNAVIVSWGPNNPTQRYSFRLNGSAANGSLWALRLEIQGSYAIAQRPLNDGQWHHVAVTKGDGATINQVSFYVDGRPEGNLSGTSGGGLINTASTSVVLGNSGHATATYGYDGAIDEVRIYDHVLSPAEIKSLAFRPRAYGPNPAEGATHEATWITLSWSPGDAAVSHDVYLGDNFEDVNARTGDTFRGNIGTTSLLAGFPGYSFPGGLMPGSTYYWRIDEVNDANPDSPWKGDVWSFTIPPKTAYSPDPADGGKFVLANVTLNWAGGLHAILHTVYFGDNFDDINNATGGLATTTAEHTPAGPLELGKTYYWRVDEFDGAATHKGNVWSFTTIPVVPVAADPNLVVLWTLDEGMGTTAVDWSGHGHHGTVAGGAQWVDGYQGAALTFGDDVYVESAYPGISGTAA